MKARGFVRRAAIVACLAALTALPAGAASLDAPAEAGLRNLGDSVFGDPDLSPTEVAQLKRMVEHARRRVALFYGAVSATPNVVFCGSTDCYREFGGVGLGFSNGANIVISPQGWRPAIVAHELAHVELASRIGGMQRVLRIVPQWFDEGLAVMVSMASEFSDDDWIEATAEGRTAPSLGDLETMEQWNQRTGRNGENMQMTYGTAKREVARWYAIVGEDGLADLITSLDTKEAFPEAYARIETNYSALALAAEKKPDQVKHETGEAAVKSPPFAPPESRGRAAW